MSGTSLALGAVPLLIAVVVAAGCGGAATKEGGSPSERPLAHGLALLPDEPELRRHVLVADLGRLRDAYPERRALHAALVGVWLPDALVGSDRPLWRRAFGLGLEETSFFASGGFHPSEVTVVEGRFSPSLIRRTLQQSGYRGRGLVMARGADGSFDPSTEAGRLALSSLDRVVAARARVIAASTSALARAATDPVSTLASRADFAAAVEALDPITAAVVLDASLVRPPSGVPVATLPRFSARLVAVGIDDLGPRSRTIKIALVYANPDQARTDATLIERALLTTSLAGTESSRFSDIAPDWSVAAEGPAVVVKALLPPGGDPGIWRLLVERGDLAPLVKVGR